MLVFNVTPNRSDLLPFFVVIKITPLPAREPYNAAALGPLSTEIDSTSLGLISVIPPPDTWLSYTLPPESTPSALIGTPSTTIKACVFPPMELFPRIVIRDPDPILPDWVIFTPAIFPVKELAIL